MFEKQALRNYNDFRTAPEITEIPDEGIFAYVDRKGYINVYVDGHKYYDSTFRDHTPILYDKETCQEIYIPTMYYLPKEVKDNYKTELQWAKLGCKVIPGAEPWLMFTSNHRTETTTDYYRIDQVEKIKSADRWHKGRYICMTGEQRPAKTPTNPEFDIQLNNMLWNKEY